MLQKDKAVLVVIDVQERLLPSIHESEFLIQQVARLVLGFRILGAPILATEQYRKGIGPTDAKVAEAFSRADVPGIAPDAHPGTFAPLQPAAFHPLEKMTFSCVRHAPFMDALRALSRPQALLCGIESHVCVGQTALDLIAQGYEVYLAADAVSSRTPRNLEIALRRLEQEGVHLTSVEAAVFEMLEVSGTPEFKTWSKVIR